MNTTILQQVRNGLPIELRRRFFKENHEARIHIAVMREPFLSLMFQGEKTVESRISINQIKPFNDIAPGDLVLLKAGAIIGAFVASKVDFLELSTGDIKTIKRTMNDRIKADNEFWARKQNARFATLIEISELIRLKPFMVSKRDMRGWVVLREP